MGANTNSWADIHVDIMHIYCTYHNVQGLNKFQKYTRPIKIKTALSSGHTRHACEISMGTATVTKLHIKHSAQSFFKNNSTYNILKKLCHKICQSTSLYGNAAILQV